MITPERNYVTLALGLASLTLGACSTQSGNAEDTTPEQFYHFQASDTSNPLGTVLILPGQSGLEILGDTTHYQDAAARWHERCFDTLTVDYRPAYRAAGRPEVGPETGHKIAWVADHAATWLEQSGHQRSNTYILAAWSLGGEGVWAMASSNAPSHDWTAAIAFYPANQDGLTIDPNFPVLAFVGTADNVTPPSSLPADHHNRLQIVEFEGAHHGFDIDSLVEPRQLRLLPLVGPVATLQYNRSATEAALQQEVAFLQQLGLSGCSTSSTVPE